MSEARLLPAATVLLLRDGAGGLEVFMVQRHYQIDFAGGALVFPGGKVDARDYAPDLRPRLAPAPALRDDLIPFAIAAIRESFEECGILLARPAGSDALVDAERLTAIEARWREPLAKGSIGILDVVAAEDLTLALDRLTHYSHWVTPGFMPKRFDTHFFLAVAPADQLALHDGGETVDSIWIRPDDAIAEAIAGKRSVIFPTRMNLSVLTRDGDAAGAVARAAGKPPVRVEPWIEDREDGQFLVIGAEAGYDRTAAPISELK
ncbi:NUDIX domain-containing protein [Zavarzinia compransoris]|uniref:NUDIX hydrolase n=1 Tax=Zavarzinia compransoris TaxID=1264899 RepID=A0A317E1W1_9PROT|nr:NUDIX domain-containing protein [Zavarzinia compransoris]PWR19125.1 NUDIX hydrolase [Zavarzinia compransoris]TDP49136.1 NUDIX domain-containing protein [Zavarzinia compransoris]